MKKLWSRLCFLVLAVSSISRGQSEIGPPHNNTHDVNSDSTTFMTPTPLPLSLDETENNVTRLMPSSSSQNSTSGNTTDLPTTDSTAQEETTKEITDQYDKAHGEDGLDTTPQTTASAKETESEKGVDNDSVTMATTSPSPTSVITEDKDSSSWGYVILVLIILVIIALCVILYLLRRVSRTYSFDLHRPSPANHCNEPTGTFEPVYLDDLDQTAPKDRVTNDYVSLPSAANGTTLQSEEKGSSGEKALQEQPDANGLETLSIGISSPSADITSDQLGSSTIFFDAIGEEQQNENNNNPSVCSSDPFVEINLDEPAWCDQLLTSPELPSSVLPFSPFSFSSSSSSSSSS